MEDPAEDSASLPVITSSFTASRTDFHPPDDDDEGSGNDAVIRVESASHARDHARHLALMRKQELWTDFAIHCVDDAGNVVGTYVSQNECWPMCSRVKWRGGGAY